MNTDVRTALTKCLGHRHVDDAESVVTEKETVIDRVMVRDHVASGADPFAVWEIELAEATEVIETETSGRIYEEIRLSKVTEITTQVVKAVVRREEAEMLVEGQGVSGDVDRYNVC